MEQKTFIKVTCSILTISDTRNLDTDTSGQLIQSALETAGHEVISRVVVPDDVTLIKQKINELAANGSFCLITNGGTGIARRDVTYEALFATIQQEILGLVKFSGCSVTKKLVVVPWCLVHSLAFQKAAYCFLRCLDQVMLASSRFKN